MGSGGFSTPAINNGNGSTPDGYTGSDKTTVVPVEGDFYIDWNAQSLFTYHNGTWVLITGGTTGTAYIQGGNAFGAVGKLGVTDNNALQLLSNNTAIVTLQAGSPNTANFNSNVVDGVNGASNVLTTTGNNVGANISIGTNDNHQVGIIANAVPMVVVDGVAETISFQGSKLINAAVQSTVLVAGGNSLGAAITFGNSDAFDMSIRNDNNVVFYSKSPGSQQVIGDFSGAFNSVKLTIDQTAGVSIQNAGLSVANGIGAANGNITGALTTGTLSTGTISAASASLTGGLTAASAQVNTITNLQTVTRSITAASGTDVSLALNTTVANTSTAGYTALSVNVTETTIGSGSNVIASFNVGGIPMVAIARTGATSFSGTISGVSATLTGGLSLTSLTSKLSIKGGTNASIGQATLVAGTVTVANTSVDANSLIFLTVKTSAGTVGILSYTTVTGTSFTITSASALDTSLVNWWIVDKLP